MTYQQFVRKLIEKFGEEEGLLMALRAEVGFLRRFLAETNPDFVTKEEANIEDFLKRHLD